MSEEENKKQDPEPGEMIDGNGPTLQEDQQKNLKDCLQDDTVDSEIVEQATVTKEYALEECAAVKLPLD